MTKPQNNNKAIPPLTQTLIAVEPNLVGFTLTNRHLEELVTNYFQEAGLELRGTVVRTKTVRGSDSLILEQFLFFNMGGPNSAITGGKQRGNQGNINPALAKKMSTGGIRLKDNFNQAIRKLALPDNKTRAFPADGGMVVVPIDPLLVVSLVVGGQPGIHRISVTNVERNKNTIYIDVFKRLEDNDFNPASKQDVFARALNSIRR